MSVILGSGLPKGLETGRVGHVLASPLCFIDVYFSSCIALNEVYDIFRATMGVPLISSFVGVVGARNVIGCMHEGVYFTMWVSKKAIVVVGNGNGYR